MPSSCLPGLARRHDIVNNGATKAARPQRKFRALRDVLLATLLLPVLLRPVGAFAQDAALDDKLRDLLHQTTEQARAAQDNAAALQTQLDDMTKQRDALQAQLAAAKAVPPISPAQQEATAKAVADAKAAQAEVASSQASLAKWQAAYQDAASVARQKDASNRQNAGALKIAGSQLSICKAENARLIDTAEDILHLYETPQFNRLLVANHDRVLGFARVKLENLVQDYDDKIAVQSYIDPASR